MRTTTLLLVILVIAAFCVGWFAVRMTNDKANDTSNIEFTVDKGKVKKDTAQVTEKAKEFGQKIKQEAKDVVGKTSEPTSAVQSRLTLDRNSIDLLPGSQADVFVTRSGGDLKELKLSLMPAADSNLIATGGEFLSGETSTRVTVRAPKDAKSGSVAITAEGRTATLDVFVK